MWKICWYIGLLVIGFSYGAANPVSNIQMINPDELDMSVNPDLSGVDNSLLALLDQTYRQMEPLNRFRSPYGSYSQFDNEQPTDTSEPLSADDLKQLLPIVIDNPGLLQQLFGGDFENDYSEPPMNSPSNMPWSYGGNQPMYAFDDSNLPEDQNPEMSNMDEDNFSQFLNQAAQALDNQSGISSSMPSASDPPSLPNPANPCPKGAKKTDNCIQNMPDTANFSKVYQSLQQQNGNNLNADMLNTFFKNIAKQNDANTAEN